LAFLNICILGNATHVFVGDNANESPKDAPDLANFVGHKIKIVLGTGLMSSI
jgi:hypothetical protein